MSDDESRPNSTIDIVIQPPEPEGFITDEDSDKSDDEVAGDFVHLPRRILAATAEIGSSAAENVPASSSSGEPIRKKMKKSRKQWVKNFPKSEIPEKPPRVFGPNIHGYLHSCCRTPAEAFSLFFSEAFLDEIIEQSHIYAKQRGSDVSITKSEFYCFLGILLVSGYHPVPYRRLYWSKEDDVHNLLVSENIRRNTFDKILQFLHFADNTKINQDRYYKIHPLFSHLNRCFKILPLNDNLSIDETMIKYYGRHGTKQFVRGKPIRFGYKFFSFASPSGYLYHAEPYCGRDTKLSETSLGLGGNVVMSLVNECHVSEGYHLFFDNWFTSFELLDMLKEHKIGATGTIRADRCKNAPLPSKKDMEKSGCGTYSQVSDGNHVLTKWYDNSVVSVLSNSIFTDTTCSASRYSQTDRKIVQVPMPKVIQCYNQSMGGVDLFDEFVNNYRTKIRSKKWWWPFFSWCLDASIVNAWLLQKKVMESTMPLLDFCRSVAQQLLKQHGTGSRFGEGRLSHSRPQAARAI